MQLIDTARAEQLYAAMGPATEISGGSAANTMVGIASFGGKAAFVGRVNDDQLGGVFGHDLRAAGVEYLTPPARRRRAHRPLSDRRHARRRAHAEHVSRCVGQARARRPRRRARGERAGALPRGLPLGRARSEGCVPPRGAARARRRQPRRIHAVRRLLRRPAPRRVPRAHRARGRRAVRQRSRDHLALPGGRVRRRAASASTTTARSPRSRGARRAR